MSRTTPVSPFAQALKQARVGHGRLVEDVAQACLLSENQINGIESDNYQTFYSEFFAKQAIKRYAEYLGVSIHLEGSPFYQHSTLAGSSPIASSQIADQPKTSSESIQTPLQTVAQKAPDGSINHDRKTPPVASLASINPTGVSQHPKDTIVSSGESRSLDAQASHIDTHDAAVSTGLNSHSRRALIAAGMVVVVAVVLYMMNTNSDSNLTGVNPPTANGVVQAAADTESASKGLPEPAPDNASIVASAAPTHSEADLAQIKTASPVELKDTANTPTGNSNPTPNISTAVGGDVRASANLVANPVVTKPATGSTTTSTVPAPNSVINGTTGSGTLPQFIYINATANVPDDPHYRFYYQVKSRVDLKVTDATGKVILQQNAMPEGNSARVFGKPPFKVTASDSDAIDVFYMYKRYKLNVNATGQYEAVLYSSPAPSATSTSAPTAPTSGTTLNNQR